MSLPADPRKKASCSANTSQGDATVTSTTNNIEETGDSAISPSTNTNSNINTSDGDEVILATAGYDHTIKFWQAHTGQCIRTLQHADSQVCFCSFYIIIQWLLIRSQRKYDVIFVFIE